MVEPNAQGLETDTQMTASTTKAKRKGEPDDHREKPKHAIRDIGPAIAEADWKAATVAKDPMAELAAITAARCPQILYCTPCYRAGVPREISPECPHPVVVSQFPNRSCRAGTLARQKVVRT